MVEYRDYGGILGGVEPPKIPIDTKRYSQVYTATHDNNGNYLSYMNRSFISFSWGGKNIEDFNLLAIIENNALQRKLYADFQDNITESDVWDGQIYWSTHFNSNNIDFVLFTDGINENQLDEFKLWFQPGKIKELIVSEHPNRGIMARITKSPEYSILPFEEKTTIKIAGKDYNTSTTLYKGRISLSFVMDDPFWYSLCNILDKIDEQGQSGRWIDANQNSNIILDDKDALKILKEDKVPFTSMLRPTTILPTTSRPNILFGAQKFMKPDLTLEPTGSRIGVNGGTEGAVIGQGHIAYIYSEQEDTIKVGQNYRYDTNINTGVPEGARYYGYFYYAGTAPCRPKISFKILPKVTGRYLVFPGNSNRSFVQDRPYTTLYVQSKKTQEFQFTLPSIYAGYNKAVDILKNKNLNSWLLKHNAVRDSIKHWAPRQYANYILNHYSSISRYENMKFTEDNLIDEICVGMRRFLLDADSTDQTPVYNPMNFELDFQNGIFIGRFSCRAPGDEPSLIQLEENVGDMILSGNLILDDRNVADDEGYISPWQEQHPEYSYRVWADGLLEDFNIEYKYLYL